MVHHKNQCNYKYYYWNIIRKNFQNPINVEQLLERFQPLGLDENQLTNK